MAFWLENNGVLIFKIKIYILFTTNNNITKKIVFIKFKKTDSLDMYYALFINYFFNIIYKEFVTVGHKNTKLSRYFMYNCLITKKNLSEVIFILFQQ